MAKTVMASDEESSFHSTKAKAPHLNKKMSQSIGSGQNRSNSENSKRENSTNRGASEGHHLEKEKKSTKHRNDISTRPRTDVEVKCANSPSEMILAKRANQNRVSRSKVSKSPSIPSSRSSPERKSIKSWAPDSISSSSREKKYDSGLAKNKEPSSKESNKVAYHEANEVIPFLILAAEKQREIIQILRYEKIDFRQKLMNEGNRLKFMDNDDLRYLSTCNEDSQSLEPRHPYNFDESYSNTLEEIFNAWLNLFYFIFNLRVNLIKMLNKFGKESFSANLAVEREILTRAIDSVKFFSMLKMKSLSDALDRLQYIEESHKTNIEIIKHEDMVSSPFIQEMEYLGNKASEIIPRIKKYNEKLRKI